MSLGKYACIDCDSSDAMELYQDDDGTYNATCFAACRVENGKGYKSHNRLADSYLKDELGITKVSYKKIDGGDTVKPKVIKKVKKEADPISVSEIKRIIANTSVDAKNFRGIRKETLERYRVRTAFCEETGAVSEVYYPITKGKDEKGKARLVGYHKRIVIPEKDFRAVGLNSKSCELFGQHLCKGKGKLVLTGGQHDVLAAYQMFEDYRKAREKKNSNIAPVDFVSGTVGETSLAAQLREQYDFVDSYDEILIDLDDDVAGKKALEVVLEVLPVQKVKVMSYAAKDANKALDDGLEDDYIRAIYNAKKPEVAGIHGSSDIVGELVADISFEKLALPSFMTEVNLALNGGYDFGTLNLICGDTSCGKTTLVNSIGEFVVSAGEYTPVILSLEAKRSILVRNYLSIHLNKRLADFRSEDELRDFLNENNEKVENFTTKEDGTDSFYVIDDRARLTTIDDTFRMLERAIVHLNCRVVVLDVMTDLMDSLTLENQNLFNGRIKSLIANHNVCIIAICHTRKLEGTTKDGKPRLEPTRHDLYGSKTTIASATTAIFIWRDLQSPDPIERNTTYVKIDKNRDHSVTGPAGRWYYDLKTNRYINREDFDKKRGTM